MALRDLKGLGEKSEQMLAAIGVVSEAEFLAADPFELYRLLKATLPSVSLNALYAMIGAQDGLSWQQVKAERKTQILMRLEDMGLAPK